jgi:hypothetical protein
MKKFFLFCCLMVSALFAVSQTKVVFTGAMLNGTYCPFEEVKVTNITKGWTETLVYPDTVLILSGLGVEEVSASNEGIIRVYPNPFEDFTNVEFGLSESGRVDVCVVGVDGVKVALWKGFIQAGVHQLRITLEKPQMAFVVITTEKERYVGKLLHIGGGGMNEIDLCSASPVISGRSNGSCRSSASGDFTPGDMMSYEGVLVHCGSMVYSNVVTQAQFDDETISLVFPEIVPGGVVQYMPYCQTFDSEFGTYMTYDVLGPQSWEIDYATAKMTGYANSTNYANEDWLISSPVAITGVSDAKMTIKYIARYFNNINDDVTIWASINYNCGSDPMTAEWIQLPVILTPANNWNDFLTAEISLTQFVGQIVNFAVKYTSTDSKAGTIEIQSICIEEGTAGGGVTPPTPQTLPYYQSFATEFGTYMPYDVHGAQSWEIDYNTAKMTGYFGGSYYSNEDWLISSPVAITGVSDAKMTMSYIGRYFNNINDEVTIWASTDYTLGDDPTNAIWRQVTASLTEGSNWSNFLSTEIALTEYVGQTVTLAVKYTSTDIKAGTMEIQSIIIEEGSGETPPDPPTPGQGEGSGVFDDPYNVAAGIGLQGEEPVAWVQGYIVGAVKAGLSSVSSNDDINWSAPFDLVTNVIIADNASCHEISQCIIVNLPAGKPLRTMVNLVDHPENLGKQLSVLGKLRKYFGQAGLRDSNGTEADFVLDGATPPNPGTEIFSETFATGQGSFTIQDVVLPSELSYVWQHTPSYSCMKASAYVGQAFNAESWLVSPTIDLSSVSDATLTFEQAVNYAAPQGALAMMISTNYNGDVTTATWHELNLDQWPAGNNWTFITSSASLSPYVGQQVTIAFKYTSSTSASATWEVKNFVVE